MMKFLAHCSHFEEEIDDIRGNNNKYLFLLVFSMH